MKWILLVIALAAIGTGAICSERWIERSRYEVVRSNHKSLAYRLDHKTGNVQVLLGRIAYDVSVEEPPVKGSFTVEEVERALSAPIGTHKD